MADKKQDYANHTRYDPWFHLFMVPTAMIAVAVAVKNAILNPGQRNSVWFVLIAMGYLAAIFRIRIYSLYVQNRVIRLEEKLRMATVLPESHRGYIAQLKDTQCVGLRFASDEELPALVERAVKQNLTRDEIKRAITNWRADNHRI